MVNGPPLRRAVHGHEEGERGASSCAIAVCRFPPAIPGPATFNAADVPNMVGVATRQELQALLGQDVRKVLLTTIHKFGEAGGKLNERSNIIVMVDEAHRTQEGRLGEDMRQAIYDLARYKLQDQFTHGDVREMKRAQQALETAIRGVEQFSTSQPSLPAPAVSRRANA